jgi:hypothetical protein
MNDPASEDALKKNMMWKSSNSDNQKGDEPLKKKKGGGLVSHSLSFLLADLSEIQLLSDSLDSERHR